MKNLYRIPLITVCVLMAAGLTAGVATADIFTFTAVLSGDNEVPAVVTPATGIATIIVDNEGNLDLPLHIEFSGLSSTQTGAHIHTGAAGTNGPVTFPLPLGNVVDIVLFYDLSTYVNLVGGNHYLNIHSENFPGGEIRGQFVLSDTVAEENTNWGSIKSLYR